MTSPDLELEGPLIEDMRIRGGGRASGSANSLSGGGGGKSSNDKNRYNIPIAIIELMSRTGLAIYSKINKY